MKKLKVIQIGMGPLGQKTVRYLLERQNFEIIGALDINPDLHGRDLGEIAGCDAIGVVVQPALDGQVYQDADCAILTTVSTMEAVTPQILPLLDKGVSVVSTCEELSHPWDESLELAREIDAAAKANQVAVLGTGINPGFLMDALPSFLTAVCQNVETVSVSRYQNAATRRLPFQKKIGAGLTEASFKELVSQKRIRHVGLTESVQMIANSLGWKLSKTEDAISPVIAENGAQSDELTIVPGGVAGVQQIGRGYVDGVEKITLDFKAWIGEPNPRDRIVIKGTPNIESTIAGGVNGDVATCAITINAVKQVIHATPGLHTMADIAPVTFFQ
ncbi:dihydrodipicolinate reductase [Verrucomicrobia bacterium]|nr:dihydrodipicolinate reductase [Verrucomicrobiota bacterium]